MPTKNYKRVPADIEEELLEEIEAKARAENIPRTRLIRMMLKYANRDLDKVIRQGDKRIGG